MRVSTVPGGIRIDKIWVRHYANEFELLSGRDQEPVDNPEALGSVQLTWTQAKALNAYLRAVGVIR
jgi:hypothetical protein